MNYPLSASLTQDLLAYVYSEINEKATMDSVTKSLSAFSQSIHVKDAAQSISNLYTKQYELLDNFLTVRSTGSLIHEQPTWCKCKV